MSALENLEQVEKLLNKTKEIAKYEKHQKKIKDLKAENKKKLEIINSEDSSICHSFFDAQVESNKKSAVVLAWFINIVVTLVGCVATFLMYKPFIQGLKDVIAKFGETAEAIAHPKEMSALNAVMEGIYQNLNIFVLLGMISIVTFSIFLIVNAFSKYNNGTSYNAINAISLLATIGLKIANIVIFGIMAYSFITVDIEFLPDYMNIVNSATGIFTLLLITLGIHVALFIVASLCQPDSLQAFLHNTTLKGAKRKDKKYFKQNKEYLLQGVRNEIEQNKVKILEEENAFPQNKIKQAIKDLESDSPIFCDFYELTSEKNEIDNNAENAPSTRQHIAIDSKKFSIYCDKLEQSKEMIKSGRASNIQDALNLITKDEQDSARTSAINAQAYQLGRLNEQIDSYNGYDDYY